MCVYSMIADHYINKWGNPPYTHPGVTGPTIPAPPVIYPSPSPSPTTGGGPYIPIGIGGSSQQIVPAITPAEIQEFRDLLQRAREYDQKNNQPDCELDSKKQKLRELAEAMGVTIEFP